jgi:hypothetical protein
VHCGNYKPKDHHRDYGGNNPERYVICGIEHTGNLVQIRAGR